MLTLLIILSSRSGGIDHRNKTLDSVTQDIRQIKEHIEREETKSTDGGTYGILFLQSN